MADQICKVNPKLHGFLVPIGELREDEMNPVTHDQRNGVVLNNHRPVRCLSSRTSGSTRSRRR